MVKIDMKKPKTCYECPFTNLFKTGCILLVDQPDKYIPLMPTEEQKKSFQLDCCPLINDSIFARLKRKLRRWKVWEVLIIALILAACAAAWIYALNYAPDIMLEV